MKEEKIGMYTREEILDYMQDCEGSMLGRSMYDAVMSKIDTLQSQLDIANNKLDKSLKLIKYIRERFELLTIEQRKHFGAMIYGIQGEIDEFLSIIGSD